MRSRLRKKMAQDVPRSRDVTYATSTAPLLTLTDWSCVQADCTDPRPPPHSRSHLGAILVLRFNLINLHRHDVIPSIQYPHQGCLILHFIDEFIQVYIERGQRR